VIVRPAQDCIQLITQPDHAHLARGRDPAVHIKQVLLGPVRHQGEAEQPAVGGGPLAAAVFQHHGAGAVAEQHAGAAVGPVHQPGHGLRADHQGAPGAAAGHEAVGHRERIDEA